MSESQSSDLQRLKDLQLELMQVEGVVAVGESEIDQQRCLKVYFADAASLAAAGLSEFKNGIRIESCVSGEFNAQ
jgi:hypothetical protein